MCLQIPVSFYGRIPGVSLIPSSIVTPPSDCQKAPRFLQIYCQNPATEFQKSNYFEISKNLKPYYIFSKSQNFQKSQNFRANHNGYPYLPLNYPPECDIFCT